MTNIENVFMRINDIQQKINTFRPEKIKQISNYYSIKKNNFANMLKNKIKNNPSIANINNYQNTNNINQNNQLNIGMINKNPNIISKNPNIISKNPNNISTIIKKASKKYNVPEPLIKSIIKNESNFNINAISKKGAMGLMQLMPKTAKMLNVKDPFNPQENIFGGTKYIKALINYFSGSLPLGLAAYNSGISRVIKAKGIPNITETKNYVNNVINNYKKYINK